MNYLAGAWQHLNVLQYIPLCILKNEDVNGAINFNGKITLNSTQFDGKKMYKLHLDDDFTGFDENCTNALLKNIICTKISVLCMHYSSVQQEF